MSLRPFGVNFAQISLFSSFKDIKVKNAALIVGADFLHYGLVLTAKLRGSSRYFVVVTHLLANLTFHTLVRAVKNYF